jgi:hypothetical protein
MKKGLLLTLYIFFTLLISFSPGVCQTTTLYVHPSSVTSTGEFNIYIKVSDVTNLYGYEFKLGYDTSILDATEVDLGSFLNEPTYTVKSVIDDSNGLVWVGVTSLNPAAPKSGSGTLATINFKVTGSGSCDLDLYRTTLGDYDANPIGHVVNDGYFSSTEATCPGDITGDGLVDIDDVMIPALAFGAVPGDPHWNPIADLTGDDLVDIDDVMIPALAFGDEC